jgi:large subunit ribosomal protein L21
MFAVIETSGKQYQVQEGRYIDVDLIDADIETTLTMDKVSAIVAGEYTQVGQPYIENATIQAKILMHGKKKKVTSYKMRRKKGYRLKQGHRQEFSRIMIENINFPNKEETLNYVKEIEEKLEEKVQAEQAKIEAQKEKRNAKKQEKNHKSTTKKETQLAEELNTEPKIMESVEQQTEVVSEHTENNESTETQEDQNQ